MQQQLIEIRYLIANMKKLKASPFTVQKIIDYARKNRLSSAVGIVM